jgi:hypothetical protein
MSPNASSAGSTRSRPFDGDEVEVEVEVEVVVRLFSFVFVGPSPHPSGLTTIATVSAATDSGAAARTHE